MKYIICAVRDQKASAFGRPIFAPSKGVAIRSFSDEINRAAQDNSMYHHSEDYALFELGTYDDFDGSFECHVPNLLVQGDSVRQGQMHITKV